MQRLRGRDGYTLVETMFIVAIIGFLATLGLVTLKNFARREDARTAARSVAGVIENARSQAVASGRMTWVVFKEPINGVAPFAPDQFAAVIADSDNDQQPTAADTITPFVLPAGPREHASLYDTSNSPYSYAGLPALDESRDVPDGALSGAREGTTLNIDPVLGVPAIGFTPQGFPVRVGNVNDLGSGAGGLYLTDNQSQVLAVVVLPLGDVKTMAFDSSSDKWN